MLGAEDWSDCETSGGLEVDDCEFRWGNDCAAVIWGHGEDGYLKRWVKHTRDVISQGWWAWFGREEGDGEGGNGAGETPSGQELGWAEVALNTNDIMDD